MEKEHENCISLTSKNQENEMRLKELTTSCTDLTAERNKLSSLVKEYKGELIRFEEMKLEYEDYKREMSQKVS